MGTGATSVSATNTERTPPIGRRDSRRVRTRCIRVAVLLAAVRKYIAVGDPLWLDVFPWHGHLVDARPDIASLLLRGDRRYCGRRIGLRRRMEE